MSHRSKMKSWCDLPVELLESFFEYVEDRSTLLECQRVCKNWSLPAQTRIYKTVQINSMTQLEQFAECMKASYDLDQQGGAASCQLVETISTLNQNGMKNIFKLTEKTCFPVILKACYRLKHIKMVAFASSDCLYRAICQEKADGGCKYLETIPYPPENAESIFHTDEDADRYWFGKAAWLIRDTIKQLWVRDDLDIIHDLDSRGENDMDYFIGFNLYPKLTHLDIAINQPDTTLFKIFSSFSKCRYLESVRIDSTKSNYTMLNTPPSDSCNNVKYDLDTKYPSIKKLRIKNAICQDKLIKYLVSTFTRLENLQIDFESKDEILEAITLEEMLLSTDVFVDFLKRLYRKVNWYYIYNVLVKDTMDVATTFLGSVNFTGFLSLEYYCDQGDELKPSVTAFAYRQDDMCLCLYFDDQGENYSMQLPHQHLIGQYGRNLQELYISFASTMNDTYEEYHHDHLQGYIFDYIFKMCPTLKTLRLCDLTLDHCDPEFVVNKHIEELVLQQCNLGERSILTELSERLPSLSSFAAIYSSFSSTGENDNHMIIIMPYTSFSTLTWASHPDDPAYKTYYIKLTLGCNESTSYYVANRKNFHMQKVLMEDCPCFTNGPTEKEMLIEMECQNIQIFGLNTGQFKTVLKNPAGQDDSRVVELTNIVKRL